MSVIHHGDNLEVMRGMESETIDLIATDPPFNTGRDFGAYIDAWKWSGDRLKEFDTLDSTIREVIDVIDRVHSESMAAFCCFLSVRLVEMRRLLKPTGSLYLHCDQTANSYIRACLDAIFGYRNFRNEIIWRRSNGQNCTSKKYSSTTDSIFFYAKDADRIFYRQPFGHLSPGGLKRYTGKDEDGRIFRDSPLERTDPNPSPSLVYSFQGMMPRDQWIWKKDRMKKAWDEGRLMISKNGYLVQKQYLDECKGRPIDNLWDDIERLSSDSTERLGYPTQKPLTLYERIIKASCPKGGVVLDPFCGSGTTLEAAKRLGRIPIGIDIGKDAIDIATKRLDRDFFGNTDLFEDQ